MDFTDHGAEQTLQVVLGQGAPTFPVTLYLKLHIGDPGADGNSNPAVNTERKVVTFDAIVSPGTPTDGSAVADTAATVTWNDLPATESYSHISLWDAATGGNSWYKTALLEPVAVLQGGFFEIQGGNGFVQHN